MQFNLSEQEGNRWVLSMLYSPKKELDVDCLDELHNFGGVLVPPFTVENVNKNKGFLDYDITGLRSLATYVDAPMSAEMVVKLFYGWVDNLRCLLQSVSNFSPDYLYMSLDYFWYDVENEKVLSGVFPVEQLPVVATVEELMLRFVENIKPASDKAVEVLDGINEILTDGCNLPKLYKYLTRALEAIKEKEAAKSLLSSKVYASEYGDTLEEAVEEPSVDIEAITPFRMSEDDEDEEDEIEVVSAGGDSVVVEPDPEIVDEVAEEVDVQREEVEEPKHEPKGVGKPKFNKKPIGLDILGLGGVSSVVADDKKHKEEGSEPKPVQVEESSSLENKKVTLVGDGKRIELQEGNFVLGKGVKANYMVSAKTISREHLKVELRNGKVYVKDNGSANGTFYNGRKLNSDELIELKLGDRLVLADVEFYLEVV